MPIDASVFNNIKDFADYQRADQDFQMRKALAAAQLQGAGIDTATKSNIYKTQLLSGAAAGGQAAYDQARQNLQQQGIDTSEYAPDVNTASQQLQAARLSQSPLGSLLNAGLKMDSNDIARAGLTGQLPSGSNVPNMIAGKIVGQNNGIPPQATLASAPAITPSVPQPPSNSTQPANNALAAFGGNNGSELPQPSAGVPTIAPGSNMPRFSPPPQNPGETLPAYNARVQQAFEAYKTDPTVLAAQEQAKKTGTLSAENTESAKKADELTNRLEQNLNAMLKLNDNVPSSGFIPAGGKVYFDQALASNGLGKGDAATAANQWDQINNQQIISEIQQFVASGGANTRINQTLDRIVQAASGINKSDLPQSRKAQIMNALAEIKNKNVSSQNIAGANQQYQPIPVTTPQQSTPPQGATLYGTSGGKNVYKMPDGSFIMEQ